MNGPLLHRSAVALSRPGTPVAGAAAAPAPPAGRLSETVERVASHWSRRPQVLPGLDQHVEDPHLRQVRQAVRPRDASTGSLPDRSLPTGIPGLARYDTGADDRQRRREHAPVLPGDSLAQARCDTAGDAASGVGHAADSAGRSAVPARALEEQACSRCTP